MTINDGVDSTALFTGFTITGDYTSRGLDILSDHNVLIERVKVIGVGGVHVNNQTVRLYEMTIKQNSRTDEGGGIKIYNSTVELVNAVIDSNAATSHYGGGVYIQGSIVTMNGVHNQ